MSLIQIKSPEFDVELYIAYATEDNFTKRKLYKNPYCFLHESAVDALQRSIELAKEHNLRIKIFDAFRPLEIQRELWNDNPDPEFISDPVNGRTPHCRGVAIDMTLVDNITGDELDMGTGFDEFSPKSHHGNPDISKESQKNRDILMHIMQSSGWEHNPREWWHYQLPDVEKYTKLTDKDAKTNML